MVHGSREPQEFACFVEGGTAAITAADPLPLRRALNGAIVDGVVAAQPDPLTLIEPLRITKYVHGLPGPLITAEHPTAGGQQIGFIWIEFQQSDITRVDRTPLGQDMQFGMSLSPSLPDADLKCALRD